MEEVPHASSRRPSSATARKLGRELDLFQINEEVGPGLMLWHPKGAMLRTIIKDWERKEHFKRGYDIVLGPADPPGPHVDATRATWTTTRESMLHRGGGPGIRHQAHELPLPHDDLQVEDPQLPGSACGTSGWAPCTRTRRRACSTAWQVRQFTQDDATPSAPPISSTRRSWPSPISSTPCLGIFGFEYEVELSTRPSNSIGTDKDWRWPRRPSSSP